MFFNYFNFKVKWSSFENKFLLNLKPLLLIKVQEKWNCRCMLSTSNFLSVTVAKTCFSIVKNIVLKFIAVFRNSPILTFCSNHPLKNKLEFWSFPCSDIFSPNHVFSRQEFRIVKTNVKTSLFITVKCKMTNNICLVNDQTRTQSQNPIWIYFWANFS